MSRIRVGLIRCDTHGLWYGPLMAEHDPMVLQRPMPPDRKQRYSWQSGGIYNFFYTRYGRPLEMTAPFVGGFEITRLWDEDPQAAEMAARVFFGKPQVCDHFEQVSDGVDLVFIADCNYDGSDHLELATPGLEKGIPTFVDKPFANTVASARQILELGRRHGAPVFSLSILRAEPAVELFRNRIPEIGEASFATLQGYGTVPAGLVHTISATQHLFGPGIQSVQTLCAEKQTIVYLDYGGRPGTPRHGIAINCDVGPRPYTALSIGLYGPEGDIHTLMYGDLIYPHGTARIIRMIAAMVQTRQAPPLMDEVVESIAVIQAVQKSIQTGGRVNV